MSTLAGIYSMRTICFIVLLAICTLDCTTSGVPTGSRILPSYFRFSTIVQPDHDPEGSGWRAVCLVATMSQGMAGGTPVSSSTVCQAEFGTPSHSRQSLRQVDSIVVSHEQARRVARGDSAYTDMTARVSMTRSRSFTPSCTFVERAGWLPCRPGCLALVAGWQREEKDS